MGRTKQRVPTRNRNNNNASDTNSATAEVLGRHVQDLPVSVLLANELRVQHETTTAADSTKQEEQPLQVAPKKKRERKKNRGRKTARVVHFTESDGEDNDGIIQQEQQPPEFDVSPLPDGSVRITLNDLQLRNIRNEGCISSVLANTDDEKEQVFSVPLTQFNLPRVSICLPEPDDGNQAGLVEERNIPDCLSINTKQGANDIWQVLLEAAGTQSSSLAAGEAVIGDLVESGLVKLDLRQQQSTTRSDSNGATFIWYLVLKLHQSAFCKCCPLNLPLQRNPRAKRYNDAVHLHQLMVAIFPGTVVSSAVAKKPPVDVEITAHQVYSLTDNIQIQKVLERHGGNDDEVAPLNIPDLVPKLRPYQQAAVEWMLKREKSTEDCDNEWILAWVILRNNLVIPLTEVSQEERAEEGIYFCPFGGWLARSLEEAKDFSVGSGNILVKGGILAESMGLGKTVEVIACLLANQKPLLQSETPGTSSIRQSLFGKGSNNCMEQSEDSNNADRKPMVVEDYSAFGDADDDESSVESTPRSNPRDSAAVVTPEHQTEEVWHEKWVEDAHLGSCICGALIGLDDMRRQQVVVCISCREPMHMQCAGFCNEKELRRQTDGIRFRQLYLNTSIEARLSRNKDCCPCCVCETDDFVESRATLIVTPTAILTQWKQEIERHTKRSSGMPLDVVVYRGVHQISGTVTGKGMCRDESVKLLHPGVLADADVVLAPFDALMSDLSHPLNSDASESRLKRKRTRYRAVPSPLLKVKWWRVCLDEAQRVETPTAKSAQMALKLRAEHRWCVSGTPVGRGKLEDLFGLLLFLGLVPFDSRSFFDKCFAPHSRSVSERIKILLSDVFWRSTRALPQVRSQMGIPEQLEKKVILQFSSIERHFYERQLESTLSIASGINDKKKRQGNKLNKLAEQLHILRAACCHPQVGSSGLGRAKQSRKEGAVAGSSLSSQVMSMYQILCKLIDDARLKCEEAQRLSILHCNAAAALTGLKIEARSESCAFQEHDSHLLQQSWDLYNESLELAKSNATPTLALGRAVLTGTRGFQSPQAVVEGGKAVFDWVLSSSINESERKVWARVDFDDGRKITEVRVRLASFVPPHITNKFADDTGWRVLRPLNVVLQVTSAAYGGEFVDVARVPFVNRDLTGDSSWTYITDFLVNKSKSWRLLVEGFEELTKSDSVADTSVVVNEFLGLEVEMNEAAIGYDPLQRLHCLHNASLALHALAKVKGEDQTSVISRTSSQQVREEALRIEALYMEVKRAAHRECHRQLRLLGEYREVSVNKLLQMSPGRPKDVWEDGWYDDFLSLCHLHITPLKSQQMVDRLRHQLDSVIAQAYGSRVSTSTGVLFSDFSDLGGLRMAVQLRISNVRSGIGMKAASRQRLHEVDEFSSSLPKRDYFRCPVGGFKSCMDAIDKLSDHPSEFSIAENRSCQVCKADWNQTGPECSHCKVGALLDGLIVDTVTHRVLRALHAQCRSMLSREKDETGSARMPESVVEAFSQIEERAGLFIEALESERQERNVASKLWKIHLELLNDLDELNLCKTTIRLVQEGENLADMTDDELNAVVQPIDISARFHEHSAKQAMALGDLRRAKSTLTYLRNQNQAHEESRNDDPCMVCLSDFSKADRAVLKCGHSFHFSPCLEKLRSVAGDICCPLRCKISTQFETVMIATEKRNDDGSSSNRKVRGSWGTKVTRLISDVLDVQDQDEKCIIFSQWEDMLDICETALVENGIVCARAASAKSLGGVVKRFKAENCAAFLLNVKSGGEGLTLIEATHVFLVEPLLNNGLDSQAIARINRIGQTRQTVVHRYLVDDTIEMKIDNLRTRHSSDALEDSLSGARRSKINAGGIDGGFGSSEELMELLA